MKKRLSVIFVIGAALSAFVGVSSASAATEFGDTCVGNQTAPGNYTLTTLSAPTLSIPLTAPISGVVTKVEQKIELSGLPPKVLIPEEVKVLHPTGVKDTFTVAGQQVIDVEEGTNVVATRIPIQAGDRLGLHGLPFVYEGSTVESVSTYCVGSLIAGELGAVPGDVPEGTSTAFGEVAEGRVPLAAVVEPDADGDGYGDETQDKCPTNSSTHDACPPPPAPPAPITLSALGEAKKGLVKITVTASAQVSVTVGGTVNLGKGSSAKLSGGTQTVGPGTLAKFKVLFPAKLKQKLKQLTPKQTLTLKLSATAPGANTAALTVKVKGQEKIEKS